MDYGMNTNKRSNTGAILLSLVILCVVWIYFIIFVRTGKSVTGNVFKGSKLFNKVKGLFGDNDNDMGNIKDTSSTATYTPPPTITDPIPSNPLPAPVENKSNKCVVNGYNVRGFSFLEDDETGTVCAYNSSWDQNNLVNSSCHLNQTFDKNTDMDDWDEKCGPGLLEFGNKSPDGNVTPGNLVKNIYENIGDEITLASSTKPYTSRNNMCYRGKDYNDKLDGCMVCELSSEIDPVTNSNVSKTCMYSAYGEDTFWNREQCLSACNVPTQEGST